MRFVNILSQFVNIILSCGCKQHKHCKHSKWHRMFTQKSPSNKAEMTFVNIVNIKLSIKGSSIKYAYYARNMSAYARTRTRGELFTYIGNPCLQCLYVYKVRQVRCL